LRTHCRVEHKEVRPSVAVETRDPLNRSDELAISQHVVHIDGVLSRKRSRHPSVPFRQPSDALRRLGWERLVPLRREAPQAGWLALSGGVSGVNDVEEPLSTEGL